MRKIRGSLSVAASWPTRAMFRTCCLFLCLFAGSYQLIIDEFEVPESAELGSDVTLKCGFELDANDGKLVPYVKWWFIPRYESDDKPILLYQRLGPGSVPDVRHGIELAGNDDIIVKNLTQKESGKYECEVSGMSEKRVNKSLTVFSKGTGPQLDILEVQDGADEDEEEDLLLECHADDVTPQPELVIYANGRPVEGVRHYASNAGDGLFSVMANVTVTKADVLGVPVKCELSYLDQTVPHPLFVDEETYTSGLPPSTTESTDVPADLRQMENATETQPNRSSSGRLNWWLSAAALLLSLQLFTLM